MTLNLIGAGFGRTGTSSLRDALNDLGYRCYHMTELSLNPARRSDSEFWKRAADNPPDSGQWAAFLEGYRAVLDFPACLFWRQLMQAFPKAKVVLTLHPKGSDAWYDSTRETIFSWHEKVNAASNDVPAGSDAEFDQIVNGMMTRLVWGELGVFGGSFLDRDAAIERYEAHNQAVRDEVPSERLLVYSADQGWAPICEALGVDTPDVPFPRRNDRSEMSRRMALLQRMKSFNEKRASGEKQ